MAYVEQSDYRIPALDPNVTIFHRPHAMVTGPTLPPPFVQPDYRKPATNPQQAVQTKVNLDPMGL